MDNMTGIEMFERIMDRFDRIDKVLGGMSRSKECFDGDTLLDNADMCQLLHVNKRTLARYRQKKLIGFYRIEGKVYYRASEVQKWMKRRGGSIPLEE